jgi:hypothetical protein
MKSTGGSNPHTESGTFRYGLRMSDPVADSVLMFAPGDRRGTDARSQVRI